MGQIHILDPFLLDKICLINNANDTNSKFSVRLPSEADILYQIMYFIKEVLIHQGQKKIPSESGGYEIRFFTLVIEVAQRVAQR